MFNFLLRKVFRENLNKAIYRLKLTSTSTNKIASFRFPRIFFLKRKLTFIFTTADTIFIHFGRNDIIFFIIIIIILIRA